MGAKKTDQQKNCFISKKFPAAFAIRFLALIVVASLAIVCLFFYIARETQTIGYSDTELRLLPTTDFFLPLLLISAIGVIIVTGVLGALLMIALYRRIADPIVRIEAILTEMDKGDLSIRLMLRENDLFTGLSIRVNDLALTMDGKVGRIKSQISGLSRLAEELRTLSASHPSLQKEFERPLREISSRLSVLQDAANHFKTSPGE